MTSPNALYGLGTSVELELEALRRELFAMHVPWHRIDSVVDMSFDGGALLVEVAEDFPAVHATLIDLSQQVRSSTERVAPYAGRVEVIGGDVLAPLPESADYYLLPEHMEQLSTGQLQRLFRSVSQACLPRGRAMACVPLEDGPRMVVLAERAGLEVTRIGVELGLQLTEFGTGLLRALPGE